SFHLHASENELPITAFIAVPNDEKSGVLLRGRYESSAAKNQIVVPIQVVREVLDAVFRVKRLFDASFASVLVTTVLFMMLVIMLSLRLRTPERRTIHHLGASRGTIFFLFLLEYLIILAVSIVIAGVLALIVSRMAPGFIQIIFS